MKIGLLCAMKTEFVQAAALLACKRRARVAKTTVIDGQM